MKLVIKTSVGDGYTFTCEVVRPVEYESAEAFLVHLEEKAKLVFDSKGDGTFTFAGHVDWTLAELGYWHDKRGPSKRAPKTQEWVWYWEGVEVLTVDSGSPSMQTATRQYYPVDNYLDYGRGSTHICDVATERGSHDQDTAVDDPREARVPRGRHSALPAAALAGPPGPVQGV